MSSKAGKKQADFCVKPCQLDDVCFRSTVRSRCSYICPPHALEQGLCLTVSTHGDSLPCPQKQSACLNMVFLGHPLQLLSARKPQPSLNNPSLSGRLRAEVRSWGSRSIIFTWKCGSMPLSKPLIAGYRGSTEGYCQVTLLPHPGTGTSSSPNRTEKA